MGKELDNDDTGTEDLQDLALSPRSNDGNQLPNVEDAKTDHAVRRGGVFVGDGRRKHLVRGTVLCYVVILAVVLVLFFSGGPKHSKNSTRGAVVTVDTVGKTSEAQYLIDNVYGGNDFVFSSASTPQAQALAWMVADNRLGLPSLDDDPYPFLQRYAIVTFAYALVPLSTRNDLQMMTTPTQSECDWNGIYADQHILNADERLQQAMTLGVICNNDDVVIQLKFPTMGLRGRLPVTEIELLKSLQTLMLDVNQIESQSELPRNPSLLHLTMSHNLVSGSIPSDIGDMTSLQVLSLSSNNLKGPIPGSISSCQNLKVVALDDNELSSGIRNLYTLPHLREVYLGSNSFNEGLDHQSFQQQPSLEVISLHDNYFSGPLPAAWFQDLKMLKHIDVHKNAVGGSEEWSNDHMLDYDGILEHLDLKSNLFYGTLPRSLQYLSSHLTHLDVSSNRLDDKIPHTIQKLTELRVLMLADLGGSGNPQPVPTWLPELTRLEYLNLQATGLTGTIPTFFGDMASLIYLDLDYNVLKKKIPSELGKISGLQFLHLNRNRLTGSVPTEITSLPNLNLLAVDNNDLTGSMGPDTEDDCPISVMIADCGNEEYDCPHCEGQDAIDAQQEISCPCCTQCCFESMFDEECNVGNWLGMIESDSARWTDVRLNRQGTGHNTVGYWFFERHSNFEMI